MALFASKVFTSCNSNWIMLLLVLCYDRFDHGSRQVKRDPVGLVMEDYDITLSWRIRMWLNSCQCFNIILHLS